MSAVDDYLRNNRSAKDDQVAEELIELNSHVQGLISAGWADNTDQSWERVYDNVFSEHISRRAFKLLSRLGLESDYYDPDTTYQEDVCAFASHLNEQVGKL